MAEDLPRPEEAEPVWPLLDRLVVGLVVVLVAVWGIFAVLTPVTVTDSQVYNLARLPLAERYGLFGNHLWYSSRQVAFPWSFDALHLVFIKFGFGYALPSFFCLLGTLFVAFRLTWDWAGKRAAWWTVLLILSMPTIVFQATSTKNDLGVVFALAAGFYALRRFQQTGETAWLAVIAVAVGFLPGIKDAGIIAAGGLLVAVLWSLRRTPRLLAPLLAGCVISGVLLGSAEIYFNNWLMYRHVLGPSDLVAAHSNRDGIRGTLANAIRYLFGFVNLAWTPPMGNPPYVPALERACRWVLHATGLVNVGYLSGLNDAGFRIAREAGETTSDYAVLGTLLVPLSFWQAIRRSWNHPAKWLAIAGFLYLGAIAYTVAWMPWNMRFLMPSFVLFALAVIVGGQRLLVRSRSFRAGLLAVAGFSAVVPPWNSFNKQPQRDLVDNVTQREWETNLELPPIVPVIHAAKDWLKAHPHGRLYVLGGGNSWVLPFFSPGMDRVDAIAEMRLSADEMPSPSRPVAVLTLDRPDFNPALAGARLVRLQVFDALPGTALYESTP